MSASPWFQKLKCLYRLLCCCIIWQQNFLFVRNDGMVFPGSYLMLQSTAQVMIPWTPREIFISKYWKCKLRGKIQEYMAQDRHRSEGHCCPHASFQIRLTPDERNSPQCRMPSRAGHTVAHGGGQVAPSVQVLDGPAPGLWFVHRALHSAFHAFKVKTKTEEKCHRRLKDSHWHKHMDVHTLLLPFIHLHLNVDSLCKQSKLKGKYKKRLWIQRRLWKYRKTNTGSGKELNNSKN